MIKRRSRIDRTKEGFWEASIDGFYIHSTASFSRIELYTKTIHFSSLQPSSQLPWLIHLSHNCLPLLHPPRQLTKPDDNLLTLKELLPVRHNHLDIIGVLDRLRPRLQRRHLQHHNAIILNEAVTAGIPTRQRSCLVGDVESEAQKPINQNIKDKRKREEEKA